MQTVGRMINPSESSKQAVRKWMLLQPLCIGSTFQPVMTENKNKTTFFKESVLLDSSWNGKKSMNFPDITDVSINLIEVLIA